MSLNDSIATGLAPGTYSVSVTDSKGKVAISSTTITQPTALAISGTATATLNCYGDADGVINITPSGGVTPYYYYWNTINGNVVNETIQNQTGLIAGTYTVTLTDKNGCNLDKVFTIAQPPKVLFGGSTVVPIVAGNDGSVTLNVTGGTPSYSYSWSSGPTTKDISGLNVGGDYKVTLTDSHAMAQKISESPLLTKLFIAPGNPGTARLGENVYLDITNFGAIGRFVKENAVEMVIVGPEEPLVMGLGNYFKNNSELIGVAFVGPCSDGALLEGSKDFAKHFMSNGITIYIVTAELKDAEILRPRRLEKTAVVNSANQYTNPISLMLKILLAISTKDKL